MFRRNILLSSSEYPVSITSKITELIGLPNRNRREVRPQLAVRISTFDDKLFEIMALLNSWKKLLGDPT
jgi:hypothetical protein